MKQLTSKATFFQKRVFPVIFGCAAGLFALLISSQAIVISIFVAIPIGLIIGFLAAIFAVHLHSEYVDEVIDDGDRILVRNRGLEESIDMREIREVSSTMMRPAGVSLHLRRDSVFGRTIKFLPCLSFLRFSRLATSLNTRIKQAEQGVEPDA